MLYDFLQVTEELLTTRAPRLARQMTALGRRTSIGDALLLVLQLHRQVVQAASDEQEDARAALAAAAALDETALLDSLAVALPDWPERLLPGLAGVLAHSSIGVLAVEGDRWTVVGVVERYGRFAAKRQDARGRARASQRARDAGWRPGEDGAWLHRETGEVVGSWRALLARLENKS